MIESLLRAVAGGGLIGLAAGLFFLVNGRILGVSGLAGAMLGRWTPPVGDAALFFAGLLIGAALMHDSSKDLFLVPAGRLAVAGLMVGIGVRLANGCTSGHGVCGLARGARRSLVATCVFMATAVLTVAFLKAI